MKKIQNITIALALVAICFSGCLGDDSNNAKNLAPEALIMMPRQAEIVEAGKPFSIDGSQSNDPDGDDLQYKWTLSGLGSPIDLSTKVSDTVVIDTPGKDLVITLLVQDSGGLTGQDIVVITVEPGNRPPTATITTPSNGGAYSEGNEIVFNGLASSDPDNDFLTYTWDLSEAGGPSYTASKQNKFSLDLSEGQYSISLTVEDPDGESSTTTHSFTVTNLPPVSKITSDVTSLFVGENIQLSGDDSYDPEGGALDFLWDFGDNKTSSLKSPEYSWNSPGEFTVSLTVEDGEGQTTTSTKEIEVKSLGPVASFTFSSGDKIRSSDNVTLDASESSALGAAIKEYKWNFGDGEELTTNESNTEYSWNSGGYYNVTLMVVDEDGEVGEITKILQVVPDDYVDEGQGNELVDGNEDSVVYDLPVEIFVSEV
ncbi:MAG: PKD domain-containing protein, partial [Candidatus Poseidoniia archaeon]|nr:PKD domain-containing protein [Candidatus Poseidoniia archaeon]